MDRARPLQARPPMVPLAAAATVVHAFPGPGRPRIPAGSLAIAFVAMAAGFAANSPLLGFLGVPDRWAWGFLGFWCEAGALLALLGMLFRQPALAWMGAGSFFAVALMMSWVAWAGHPVALALVGAVAAWHLRHLRQVQDAPRPEQGWRAV